MNDRPAVGDRVGDAGRVQGDLLDLVHDFDRALQRGRVGQLDVDHQPALVLGGNEAGGNAREAVTRQTDQADIDQQHDRAEAQAPAHGPAIGPRRPHRIPS